MKNHTNANRVLKHVLKELSTLDMTYTIQKTSFPFKPFLEEYDETSLSLSFMEWSGGCFHHF